MRDTVDTAGYAVYYTYLAICCIKRSPHFKSSCTRFRAYFLKKDFAILVLPTSQVVHIINEQTLGIWDPLS